MIKNGNRGFFVDFLPTFRLNAPAVISNEPGPLGPILDLPLIMNNLSESFTHNMLP